MQDIRHINIGILHNAYLKKGGEDNVAESEFDMLRQNNYRVFYLHFNNPENKLKQLFIYWLAAFNPFSFFKCYRWIKLNKIDILHVHNWFYAASPSVLWAAKLCKIPVVMTIHNYRMICPSGTLIFDNKPYFNSLQQSFAWDAVKNGVYRSSRLLTFNLAFILWFNKKIATWNLIKKYIILTEHSKSVFQGSHLSYLTERFIVKPNFLVGENQKPVTRQKDFLFVGRLSDEKGINLLLAAFKSSSHHIKIIGDGPLQTDVENFARENSNVTYLGFKGKNEILKELGACTALIFPSIWYETFGLILIEAFSTSTPVIASYYGSASIIVKDHYNGLHFEKSNVSDLKDKIDLWASLDDTVKKDYYNNAYVSYLKYYTVEANLQKLIEIYQQVL